MAEIVPLTRWQISKWVGNDAESIRAIEDLFKVAGSSTPADITALEARVTTNEGNINTNSVDIDQLEIDVVAAQTDATQALADAAAALAASETPAVDTYTSSQTLTTDNRVVLCDATSGAMTITLYTAAGNEGRELQIKKIDSTANFVTIDGNASETIDDVTTFDLELEDEALTLRSDGSDWVIL